MRRRESIVVALALCAIARPACSTRDTEVGGDAGRAADAGGAPQSMTFEKHVVDPAFRSEGVAVFDVNRDGHVDLVTEELWYEGPAFTATHEVREARTFDPMTSYAHCFSAFHRDLDGDGFEDLIVIGPPGEEAKWCTNPRGAADRRWDCHSIAPSAAGESPHYSDLFADGAKELVMGAEPDRVLAWVAPADAARVDAPWVVHALTEPAFPEAARFGHGLGVGDLNGDGRRDLLTGSGWLEHPVDPASAAQGKWRWHPVELCPNDCAHMFTFDFDGDGLADIVGTSPHKYGVSWWRQRRSSADAEPTFEKHSIDTTLSQTHAAQLADLDGDGLPELITGKRWYVHFTSDPGALDPAVLAVYRFSRQGGDVSWTRIDVDADSGVGSQFEIADVNGDGRPDIVVSNKKGLAWFEQK